MNWLIEILIVDLEDAELERLCTAAEQAVGYAFSYSTVSANSKKAQLARTENERELYEWLEKTFSRLKEIVLSSNSWTHLLIGCSNSSGLVMVSFNRDDSSYPWIDTQEYWDCTTSGLYKFHRWRGPAASLLGKNKSIHQRWHLYGKEVEPFQCVLDGAWRDYFVKSPENAFVVSELYKAGIIELDEELGENIKAAGLLGAL